MADEFEPGGGFRAIGIIKAGSRYMYAAFASISMDAMDAVALNRDEDCMLLRRGDTFRNSSVTKRRSTKRRLGLARGTFVVVCRHAFSIHTPLIPQVPLRHRFCGARTAVYGVYNYSTGSLSVSSL